MGRSVPERMLGVPDRFVSPRCAPGDPRPLPPTVLSWDPMVVEKAVAAWFYTRYSAGRSPNDPPQPQHLGGGAAVRSQSGAPWWAGRGGATSFPAHHFRPENIGVRSEWLTALHGRGSAGPLLWRGCVASGGNLSPLDLFCPAEENKMAPP